MLIIITFTVLCILIAMFFLKQRYSYWERLGFPTDQYSRFPYGCLESVAKHKKSMGMAMYDVYKNNKERFVGIYLLFRPAILVRDAELARRILAQDFSSFHDRGIYVDEENDPLSGNLFALRGQSWRSMRLKLGPSFTAGKMKAIFHSSDDIGNKMVEHINTILPKQGSMEIDLKEICTTFAIDVIGATIFGLDINSYANPKNDFRVIVEEARKNTFLNAIFLMFMFLIPSASRILFKITRQKNVAAEAFLKIIKNAFEYREKHNIIRKDMLQLLLQLHHNGKIEEDDSNWSSKKTNGIVNGISMESIAAQSFFFYIAGQETTASTIAFTIFELAQYPVLLERAQAEVDETLKNNSGAISYETLQKMEFLELCIQETIRKYPGLPLLNRECTEDYTIPETNLIIKKGTPIIIPLFGIHRDAENFPDPENYVPERFLETNQNYNKTAYMPFGEGPRICIAQRMGRINAKLALVKILQNFNIEIEERHEIEIDNYSIPIIPKGGVKVRLSKRN